MKNTGIILIMALLVGCGGSQSDPMTGQWTGRYETQFDETNKGDIQANISGNVGIVTIDGIDHRVEVYDNAVSGQIIGRMQIEGDRLAFRLQSGAPGVIYGWMVRK